MKCGVEGCGEDSRVLATRGTRRNRICAKGHRYTTHEVVADERQDYEARDEAIRTLIALGVNKSTLAAAVGIGRKQVNKIVGM